MSNFEPNAVIRGFQLTVVGSMSLILRARSESPPLIAGSAVRALQNPELFKYEHFRQAALAVAIGIIIHLIIQIPVCRSFILMLRLLLTYCQDRRGQVPGIYALMVDQP